MTVRELLEIIDSVQKMERFLYRKDLNVEERRDRLLDLVVGDPIPPIPTKEIT